MESCAVEGLQGVSMKLEVKYSIGARVQNGRRMLCSITHANHMSMTTRGQI